MLRAINLGNRMLGEEEWSALRAAMAGQQPNLEIGWKFGSASTIAAFLSASWYRKDRRADVAVGGVDAFCLPAGGGGDGGVSFGGLRRWSPRVGV